MLVLGMLISVLNVLVRIALVAAHEQSSQVGTRHVASGASASSSAAATAAASSAASAAAQVWIR